MVATPSDSRTKKVLKFVVAKGVESAPKLEGSDFWDAVVFGSAIINLAVFFTPLGGWLQTTYTVGTKISQSVEDTKKGAEKKVDAIAPDLQKTPEVDDEFNGFVVTSGYGPRDIGVGSTYHYGIDLAAKDGKTEGKPVYAIALPGDSVDVKCWEDPNGGGTVATFTSDSFPGYEFSYLHLSQCSDGKHKAGSVIAKMGSTGTGTGAHLDFRYKKEGDRVPPNKYFTWFAVTGQEPKPTLERK